MAKPIDKIKKSKEFEEITGCKILDPDNYSRTEKTKMSCNICSHIFEASPKTRLSAFSNTKIKGCPQCGRNRQADMMRSDRNPNNERFKDYPKKKSSSERKTASAKKRLDGFTEKTGFVPVNEYQGVMVAQDIQCIHCGNIEHATPKNKIQYASYHKTTHACTNCNGITDQKLTKKEESYLQMIEDVGYELVEPVHDFSNNLRTTVTVKPKGCDHEITISIVNLLELDGCRICNAKANVQKMLRDKLGIEIVGEYSGKMHDHHTMKCLDCSHEFEATPTAKKKSIDLESPHGCPKCSVHARNQDRRSVIFDRLAIRGLEVISPVDWNGQRNVDGTRVKLTLLNKSCGHEFTITSNNIEQILNSKHSCATCGADDRTRTLNEHAKIIHDEWLKTAPAWRIYQSKVISMTKINYENNKDTINPNNYPRVVSGSEDGYQLDHIVSVRYCFENDIPEHICAHPDNLQMLTWQDNVAKSAKLQTIPSIFKPYIDLSKISVL